MLEPLAASVISTVLSARQFAVPTSAQSAFKSMGRISSSPLPQNFFNPHPRRSTKGKEREHSGIPCGLCAKEGVSSRCVSNVATTSTSTVKSSGVPPPKRPRIRRTTEHRLLSDAYSCRFSKSDDLQRQSRSPQRRHASSVSELQPTDGLGDRHSWRLRQVILGKGKLVMDEAWRSYEFLRLEGTLNTLSVPYLMTFADKVAAHADEEQVADLHAHRTHWGARLSAVLRDMDSRLAGASPNSVLHVVWGCLSARAFALTDRIDDALELCHSIEVKTLLKANERHFLRMYQTILLVLSERQGPAVAVRFLIDEWETLEKYLPPTVRDYHKELLPAVQSFRAALWDILRDFDHAEQFFGSVDFSRPSAWHQLAGAFLMRTFCEHGFPLDAAKVVRALYGRKEDPPWRELMVVVKTLAKHRSFDVANALFLKARQRLPSLDSVRASGSHPKLTNAEIDLYHKTGLYLYAHQGDVASANKSFNEVSPSQRASSADIGLLIHAYALAGDPKGAIDIFDHYSSTGMLRPNIIHYSGVILAHARKGDFVGMEEWTVKLTQAGFRPDGHVYSIILQGFAERNDMSSVGKILRWMKSANQPLSAYTATSVIAMLARKKDFNGAEEMFKLSVDEGVVPDRQMVTAVMNAHVEAGNWTGIISTFDYLKVAAKRKQFPLSIETFNTLLKAYVLAGAPWSIISTLRDNMKDIGLQVDAYTYSLLIQAACDNNLMAKAHKLYEDMQRRASAEHSYLRINVFVLTILMAGWLKKSNRKKAMEIYETMLSQDIKPTSITFHHIIKAYSDQKSKRSIEVAVEFLEELMKSSDDKSWLSTSRTIRSGLDHVYGPVLTAYGRLKDPQKVEQLIGEMRQHGGKPSLGSLTALLDAYRRAGDLEGVKNTWSLLFNTASSSPSGISNDSDLGGSRPLGTALCIPLSIFIDAASSAGKHEVVTTTWKLVREAGFAFDAHNWNQLAIAAVRAGEPMRAFQVLQEVLIPHHRDTLALRGRDDPTDPVTPDHLVPEIDNIITGSEGGSRDKGRRYVNIRMERRRLVYLMYKLRQAPHDSATPLHAMYRISPAWSDWSAHPKVLELLLETLERLLADGLVVRVPEGGGAPVPRTGIVDSKFYEKRGYARQNLKHIMANSSDAIAVVLRWKNSIDRTRFSGRNKTPLSQTQPTVVQPALGRRIRAVRTRFVKRSRTHTVKAWRSARYARPNYDDKLASGISQEPAFGPGRS
ncbi:hypothetical protein BDY19DRAFT_993291 [Irpex rosettiformis]|uniref:Uncharacterized protein n=1 Tax=Irpex rosettiformis TaxID=378272 RepID=A0ACB8U423_9APHY|nr:hypothetical protein BDY19DRAFT_993291 [Irpex rosettiformis]